MATKPVLGCMSVATFRRGFADQQTTVSDFLCTISNADSELVVSDFDRNYELQLFLSSLTFRTLSPLAHARHTALLMGCIFLFLQWLRAYGVCAQVLFRALRRKSGVVEVLLNLNGCGSSKDDRSELVIAVIDFGVDIRAQLSDIGLAMTDLWPSVTAVHVISQTAMHPDVRLSALMALFPGFLRLDDDNPKRDVFVEDRKGSGLIFLVKLENGYAKDSIDISRWTPTRQSLAQLVFDEKHKLWSTAVVTAGTTDFVETLSRLPNVQCFWLANNSQLTVLPDCLVCSLPYFMSAELEWLVEVANNARACLPLDCRVSPLQVSCVSIQTNAADDDTCTVVIALATPISGLPDQFHPPGTSCTPLPVAPQDLASLIGDRAVKRLIVYTADRIAVRRAALTAIGLKMIHYNMGLTMSCKIGFSMADFRLVVDAGPSSDAWTASSSKLLTCLHKKRDAGTSKKKKKTAGKK